MAWRQREGRDLRRRRALRLTDEAVAGRRRPAGWVNATVAAALALDRGTAFLGLARPVLLVSGFWRSGTTWLQECFAEGLGAKTVFEPLSPMEPRRRAMLGNAFATEDVLQAFVPGPEQAPGFWRFLEAAARGRTGSRFSLSCRRGLADSLRTRIVVKDVRLHRNLEAAHARLGVPVVHVRRHPCAVVASLRAADWHWRFERVSLRDWPLPPADPDLLRACDGDAVSRLAAFWALHERDAASALHDRPWACEMTYEALLRAPEREVAAAADRLGLRLTRRAAAERPSASVDPAVFARTAARPPDFWRESLGADEVARIEQVVSALYPAWRRHWAA